MSTCQTLQFLERSESIVTTQFSDLAHFLPLAGSVYAFSTTFFIHFWDAFPHQVSSTRCSENSDGLVLRGTRFLSFTFFSLVHLRKEQECPRLEAWIASKDVLEPWDLWMLSWGSSKYLAHQQCTCSVGWLDAAQCVLPFPVVIHEDHPWCSGLSEVCLVGWDIVWISMGKRIHGRFTVAVSLFVFKPDMQRWGSSWCTA